MNSKAVPVSSLFAAAVMILAVSSPTATDAQQRNPYRAVEKRDADGDGRVSREEWERSGNIFKRIDKNKDGYLTPEDFAKHWGMTLPEKGTAASGSKNSSGGRGQAQDGRQKLTDPDEIVRRLDRDGDGKVARKEWRRDDRTFKANDANGDGFITRDEFAARLAKNTGGGQQAKRRNQTTPRNCKEESVPNTGSAYVIETYKPNCVFEGTTLFVDNANLDFPRILEIDMRGRIVWSIDPRDATGRVGDRNSMGDVARLANGNTLFTVMRAGVYEVDRAGKLVWKFEDNDISHDADRLPNGNTLVVRGWVSKGGAHVQEITPGGEIAWSWTGLPHFDRAPYDDVEDEGWIHANAATRMPNGNTWITLRNFDMVVEVAPSGEVLTEVKLPPDGAKIPKQMLQRAEKRGTFKKMAPHDPDILPGGRVLVPLSGINRVIVEAGSGSSRKIWQKIFREDKDIYHVRDANRLPNGNTLVASARKIVEITRKGEIVWKMDQPELANSPKRAAYHFFKAIRIGPDGKTYGD